MTSAGCISRAQLGQVNGCGSGAGRSDWGSGSQHLGQCGSPPSSMISSGSHGSSHFGHVNGSGSGSSSGTHFGQYSLPSLSMISFGSHDREQFGHANGAASGFGSHSEHTASSSSVGWNGLLHAAQRGRRGKHTSQYSFPSRGSGRMSSGSHSREQFGHVNGSGKHSSQYVFPSRGLTTTSFVRHSRPQLGQ